MPEAPGQGPAGFGGKAPAAAGPGAVAALQELPAEEFRRWRLPENLVAEGPDTLVRVVTGAGLLAPQALELSTGAGGRAEYFLELEPVQEELQSRFQFLSTQGTGRLRIAALDGQGRTIAAVGYVFTGSLPEKTANTVWIDRRPSSNFQGNWVQERIRPAELLAAQLPAFLPETAARYRVSLEAGNGQHALITELKPVQSAATGMRVIWRSVPARALQGEILTLGSEIVNQTDRELENISVQLHEPAGYGLTAVGASTQQIPRLPAGGTVSLSWQVRAQRDSSVNLGQPWRLSLGLNGVTAGATARIHVTDPAPGRIFYVMTEDLEPMDAAGYPTAWGNQNGWLDAEEFRVHLVNKAEALNRIAEKHGAYWTHYLAMPALAAGEWAAAQSDRTAWQEVLGQVRRSVRSESRRGHEYALHLHSDYDPEVPGNVLSFNRKADGFWANHLRHGWAHSFPAEGDAVQRGTRTGILFHHLKELTQLTASYPGGEILTSRTGSFDFGNGPESEAMSIRAYRAAGLWGNSDADGNAGGITSGDYGKALYLTSREDINSPAADLANLGLVEFRPTPRQLIMYDVDSVPTLNEKVSQGVRRFTEDGRVRPGVHSIVGFTHAMFILGASDWQSTSGRHFQNLDEHLGFLKREFVQKGVLHFATATTLVREYLDYYWPEPLVLCGPMRGEGAAGTEFALDFLGRHIPVDRDHTHLMTLQIPIRYRDSGLTATLLKNGQPIQELFLAGGRYELRFSWGDRRDEYRLVIGQRPGARAAEPGQLLFGPDPVPAGQAPPWPPQPDMLFPDEPRPRFR